MEKILRFAQDDNEADVNLSGAKDLYESNMGNVRTIPQLPAMGNAII